MKSNDHEKAKVRKKSYDKDTKEIKKLFGSIPARRADSRIYEPAWKNITPHWKTAQKSL